MSRKEKIKKKLCKLDFMAPGRLYELPIHKMYDVIHIHLTGWFLFINNFLFVYNL